MDTPLWCGAGDISAGSNPDQGSFSDQPVGGEGLLRRRIVLIYFMRLRGMLLLPTNLK
jgi:hypothetical protein